jgi:hypothetical protein
MRQLSLLEECRLADPRADDRKLVARVADGLLLELDARAPIKLGMVASLQGIATVRRCALPNAGCLLTNPDTGRLEIRLRASDHPRRQRFSGFHEVAHTFMPGYQLQMQLRCDPPILDRTRIDLESLCDIGASELLLPERLFAADLRHAPFSMDTVSRLSDVYDASLQATAHRVVDLWPEDALFVLADVRTKPTERHDREAIPKLRVSYAWAQGRWPFILRHKSIAPGDALERALQGEFVDERATLTGISTQDVAGVHVSARLCPYTDARGESHARVLALYRRPSRRA